MNLSGRKWQKPVQKLDDRDAFVISKCLKNYMLVTGEQIDSGLFYILPLYNFFLFIFLSTDLDMSYNHITDEGVKHIADLLRVRKVNSPYLCGPGQKLTSYFTEFHL